VTVKLDRDVQSILRTQDYGARPGIDGVVYTLLRRFNEQGGSMTELSRFHEAGVHAVFSAFTIAQLNYSMIEPGVMKAFHVHRRQTDIWFVPPDDRVLLVLIDVREGSPDVRTAMKLMLGDGNSVLVKIPPGVAHGCKNLGDRPARIIYMTDVEFSSDPAVTDEGRLPWDLIGPEIWEPAKD
jgi:dTDP-4-dehydrorhamnose 3,5-epimerase